MRRAQSSSSISVDRDSTLVVPRAGWTYETGLNRSGQSSVYYRPAIENPDEHTEWYANFFCPKEHRNYYTVDDQEGVVFVSIVKEDDLKKNSLFRGIVWTKNGAKQVLIDGYFQKGNKVEVVDVLLAADPSMERLAKRMKPCNFPVVARELLALERQSGDTKYKFGIVYMKEGQTTEAEAFANDGSEAFDKFLSVIGTRINLKGWDGYRAQLDVANDMTGKESVFAVNRGYDIMFHVSTLLPHDGTSQEVQRKRHIGNDIINIIFVEGKTAFDPKMIDTQYTHVYAVVRPHESLPDHYRLSVVWKDTVPEFGPSLAQAVWSADHTFVDFLLTKLINGERAVVRSPEFAIRERRTTEGYLNHLVESIQEAGKSPPITLAFDATTIRRATSRTTAAAGTSPPTEGSVVSASDSSPSQVFSRSDIVDKAATEEIFEYRKVVEFPTSVLCLDTWADDFVFGTAEGIFVYDQATAKTRNVSKLVVSKVMVMESLGIAIIQKASNKEVGYFYLTTWKQRSTAFLREAAADASEPTVGGRSLHEGRLSENRLRGTKGAHFLAVGQPRTKVYLCVALKKELVLYGWDATLFTCVSRYSLPVAAKCVQFMGTSLCVAFHTEFDEVELETGVVRELFVPKTNVVPLDVLHIDNKDMLLCYNNTGLVINRKGAVARRYELKWTMTPSGFAYSLPYVIAVTRRHVEVRTMLNGSLIQLIHLPTPLRLLSSKNAVFVGTETSRGGTAVYEIKPNLADSLLALSALNDEIAGEAGATGSGSGGESSTSTKAGSSPTLSPHHHLKKQKSRGRVTDVMDVGPSGSGLVSGGAGGGRDTPPSEALPLTGETVTVVHLGGGETSQGAGGSSGSKDGEEGRGGSEGNGSASAGVGGATQPPSGSTGRGEKAEGKREVDGSPREQDERDGGEGSDTTDSEESDDAPGDPMKNPRVAEDLRKFAAITLVQNLGALLSCGNDLESLITDHYSQMLFRDGVQAVQSGVSAVNAVLARYKAHPTTRPNWPLELEFNQALATTLVPLKECTAGVLATEKSERLRCLPLESDRCKEAKAAVDAGVARLEAAGAHVDGTMAGTRATLMAIKTFKGIIDEYVVGCQDPARSEHLKEFSVALAESARDILTATRAFVATADNPVLYDVLLETMAEVKRAATQAISLALREALIVDLRALVKVASMCASDTQVQGTQLAFTIITLALMLKIAAIASDTPLHFLPIPAS